MSTESIGARHARYTAVAIVLHWAIAFAIAFNIPLGWWMHEGLEHPKTFVAATAGFQLHKSIGLTVLVLSLIRLGWRLVNPPPPLPASMPGWEKFAALATHWGFYALMIAMPLTGWLYVSAGWSAHENQPLVVSTYWFHLFRVPPLFDLVHQTEDVRRGVAGVTAAIHGKLAWVMIALATLHVAAALKHQFIDRDEVLAHMVPGLKAPNETVPPPKNAGRGAILGFGFAIIAVALVAGLYSVTHLGPIAAPAEAAVTPPAINAPTATTAPTNTAPTNTALAAPSGAGPATPIVAGAPPAWRVDQSASSIGFAAVYTDDEGNASFHGSFSRWRADIHFDPADLPHSSAVVTIDMASGHDGIQAHDAAMPTEPWFNVPAHPSAEFRTSAIRHLAGDNYEARGTLTLKGHAVPITLPFTLTIAGAHASMSGHVSLTRAAADIGVRDPEGNTHISPGIDVTVHVEATRG